MLAQVPTDPTLWLAYPAFGLLVAFGANMMRRQRDTDRRQAALAVQALELNQASITIALERERDANARADASAAAQRRLLAELERRRDEPAGGGADRGAPDRDPGGGAGP